MSQKSSGHGDIEESFLRLAVLIDADNAQAAIVEALLGEVSRLGEATVKRIYGDFTASTSSAWKKVLQQYSIKPVQQFAYTTGKNATDSALIIDAMDLLYTRRFGGFCLVSSDSDYTGLAVRIREEGLVVFGFGETKTPEAFRNACNKFVFTEVLREEDEQRRGTSKVGATSEEETGKARGGSGVTGGGRKFPRKFVLSALEQSVDDSGWAHLGTFGNYLVKLQPDFDPRLYGYKKLSDLVKAKPEMFVVEERAAAPGGQRVLYVRAK